MTPSPEPFSPDWVSPPGDTIRDLMEEQGLSRLDLARKAGCPLHWIDGLIDGSLPITRATAVLISAAVGGSVQFWLAREAQYRAARNDDARSG